MVQFKSVKEPSVAILYRSAGRDANFLGIGFGAQYNAAQHHRLGRK
jgi:hypothetical protein